MFYVLFMFYIVLYFLHAPGTLVIKIHCVSKKTCDYILYNNFSLAVIERWFHFPPHLSSVTTLPWEITEHRIGHCLIFIITSTFNPSICQTGSY